MLPWILCILMSAAVLILCGKLWFLNRGLEELCADLEAHLSVDTNTLLSVPGGDRHLRRVAVKLNKALRLLRSQRQRYQSGDQELREAITAISHDLRTPLTAICGYLELLEREEKPEQVRRYLSYIENRVDAMRVLTEELFHYSLAASRQELNTERLDIVRSLEDNLLSFYGAMQEKGITPVLTLPRTAILRDLDANALTRIFSNIISNAVKYSDGDLAVSVAEDGQITFSNHASELDAVTVGRLFDRFYTVESGRNSTGLGLSIAKLLTERMGGGITAEYVQGVLSIHLWFYTRSIELAPSSLSLHRSDNSIRKALLQHQKQDFRCALRNGP